MEKKLSIICGVPFNNNMAVVRMYVFCKSVYASSDLQVWCQSLSCHVTWTGWYLNHTQQNFLLEIWMSYDSLISVSMRKSFITFLSNTSSGVTWTKSVMQDTGNHWCAGGFADFLHISQQPKLVLKLWFTLLVTATGWKLGQQSNPFPFDHL